MTERDAEAALSKQIGNRCLIEPDSCSVSDELSGAKRATKPFVPVHWQEGLCLV